MLTVEISVRIALTATPSAPFLSPRPTQRPAAMAAASVTRTSSRAGVRAGGGGATAGPAGGGGGADRETVWEGKVRHAAMLSGVPGRSVERRHLGRLHRGPDRPARVE